MARRGFTLIFTLLGLALVVSIAGFAMLYVFLDREPPVPGDAKASSPASSPSRG